MLHYRIFSNTGLILLAGYVLFDSFTSNWQGELFSHYKMTSFQMMCGVNFFSIIFCGVSLVEQGGEVAMVTNDFFPYFLVNVKCQFPLLIRIPGERFFYDAPSAVHLSRLAVVHLRRWRTTLHLSYHFCLRSRHFHNHHDHQTR